MKLRALVRWVLLLLLAMPSWGREPPEYDIVIHGGTIYDGSGQPGYAGDVAIRGDRIAYVGPRATGRGKREIDAGGRAVAPGFINMLSWAGEALLIDGGAQSDLRQGVTLAVMGEGVSMGPLSTAVKRSARQQQGDLKYSIAWTTLGDYLELLERKGVAINVSSYVGAATARMNVLGSADIDPTPRQLESMRRLVRDAMEQGALGVSTSLIYPPGVFADTPELIALAQVAARCGGLYATHMRSEGDRFLEAVDETIEIARRSGAPAEIFHLKVGGKENWPKMQAAIERIDAARASGLRITTDMYPYPASGTTLTASMPPWVQTGDAAEWTARLRDPALRARVIAEMRAPQAEWENVMRMTGGPQGVLLTSFESPALKPFIGKTLADVARERGVSPEDALVDLVIADVGRALAIYFTMSADNLRRQVVLPYMTFSSDAPAISNQGVFLKSREHPRAYGAFARVYAQYVRRDELLTIEQAVRKMTAQPAAVLGLRDRGALRVGNHADIVIFDPERIADHATFVEPHQYATGVSHVFVNGTEALSAGVPTRARPGKVVRGRAWTGWDDGGCRKSAADWH